MSMTAGGSSPRSLSKVSETVFNVAHEHDVLALLRQIHISPLSLDIKNYLRDLVFSTRFEPKVVVDETMVTTLATHGFSIVYEPQVASGLSGAKLEVSITAAPQLVAESKMIASPVVSGSFGHNRVIPSFTTPAPSVAVTTPKVDQLVPENSLTTKEPVVPAVDMLPSTPEPAQIQEPEVAKTSEPLTSILDQPIASSEAVEEISPIVVSEVAPVEEAQTSPEPTVLAEVEPGVVYEVTSAPEVAPTLATEVSTVSSEIDPATRIAEIKRGVNSRVGNPVNLIDAHNEVGREYMNALLDAMKKTMGSVTAQEVERAMARLERAYVAVLEALDNPHATVDVPPAVTEEISNVPVANVVPETSTLDIEAEPSVPEESVGMGWGVQTVSEAVPEAMKPETPEIQETIDESALSGFAARAAVAEISSTVSDRMPFVQETTPVVPVVADIAPVAKEKQLKDLMEARTAAMEASEAERVAEAKRNPLMAEDVTSGLHQLLAEWKLFKSSGIFGTGPSGYEHPLYKKLSGLTMAAVLAGRFEGASNDIKQSITDYMNGWRYEEGVTHEPGETFENYLRRVIRHILDKQKEGK